MKTELLIMIVYMIALWVAVKRDYRKTKDYQESLSDCIDELLEENDKLKSEKKRTVDNHYLLVSEHITLLNERSDMVKKLRRKIANRDGQITKLKNKMEKQK